MDLGKLDTRVGQTIVSAAVIDDALSLVLLAVLTGVMQDGEGLGWISIVIIFGKALLFFAIAGCLGHYLFPVLGRSLKKSRADEFEFSMLLVAAMAYAMLAEALGLHFILGAFLAGLFFRRRTISQEAYDDILRKTKGITTGFLAPIFFASIGMHMDLHALLETPLFVLGMILIATLGKVMGAGLSARGMGLTNRQSLAIGAGMNARGAVELIIADIALRAGIFSTPTPVPPVISFMFSAVVFMAIVTTLMTPPALKFALQEH